MLRSGGLLLLSTPDHGLLSRLCLALSAGAFQARFDPRGDHLRFYTRQRSRTCSLDFGFEDVAVRGAGAARTPVLLASAQRKRF